MSRVYKTLPFLYLLAAIGGVLLVQHALAQDTSSGWISPVAPRVEKVVDLPASVIPADTNIDCQKQWYTPGLPLSSEEVCVNASPLGNIGPGNLYIGSNSRGRLYGPQAQDDVEATPDSNLVTLQRTSGQPNGNYFGFYHSLTQGDLQTRFDGKSNYYVLMAEPDSWIINPATGNKLPINGNVLGFSSNMHWLVADTPVYGLVRVDLNDMTVMPFARSLEGYDFYGLSTAQITITNDGRYVAVAPVQVMAAFKVISCSYTI